MAKLANDLRPGDQIGGKELATVSRTGTVVTVTFTDKRLAERALERYEPVPDDVERPTELDRPDEDGDDDEG